MHIPVGTLVKVLYNGGGRGTCLSAPTPVLATRTSESGTEWIAVAATDDMDDRITDEHPVHGRVKWTTTHGDFVSRVTPHSEHAPGYITTEEGRPFCRACWAFLPEATPALAIA